MTHVVRLSLLLLGLSLTTATHADPTADLLEELTNAHGPSGFEGPVRDIMRREMGPLADRVEVDGLGSVIGSKRTHPQITIMLRSHQVTTMIE